MEEDEPKEEKSHAFSFFARLREERERERERLSQSPPLFRIITFATTIDRAIELVVDGRIVVGAPFFSSSQSASVV